jgi:hypothetical protein
MQNEAKRRRLSAAQWPEVVARLATSGLNAEAFAQRERVSLASLRRWQQELGQNSAVAAGAAGFVDLGSLRASSSRFEVRLELGDGVLLTLSRG